MAHLGDTDENNLDCIGDIYDLGDLFTAVYRGSDYRFGCLHFAEPMGDGNYPDYIAEPPDFMKSGWTLHHEIPMVLHPDKGALLLSVAGLMHDEPPELLTAHIEEEHSRLVSQEWKIRNRLESIGYWKNRAIVIGVGVVTRHRVADELRPENVAQAALIDRDALPHFATHVDALFNHYTTPAAQPVEEWGQRLVADITDSQSILGGFLAEDSHIERYEDYGWDLDGLVEPAA
jgi:hypothetical protein